MRLIAAPVAFLGHTGGVDEAFFLSVCSSTNFLENHGSRQLDEHYPLNGRFIQGVFRARDRVLRQASTTPDHEGRTSSGNNLTIEKK